MTKGKIWCIFFLFLLCYSSLTYAEDVKKADLAGKWYPFYKTEIRDMILRYFDLATPPAVKGRIFAIISPHAGYQFSGPVAAYGFKAAQHQDVKTVVIIGFSHRKYSDSISVYDRGFWETPLGKIAVDEVLARQIISKNSRIKFDPSLFSDENSVEMQVPFVQMAFKDAKIVPIAFGTQDYQDAQILAGALSDVLKDRGDVLLVASTDMSHYHPYEEANAIDKRTIETLLSFNPRALYDECQAGEPEFCGLMPVAAVLLTAEKLGYKNIEILKYANSGDTFGEKGRVVGYLSAAIYEKDLNGNLAASENRTKSEGKEMSMLNDKQKKRLLQIARESITSFVRSGERKNFSETDPVLNEEMGAFVTLHEGGELRGCIGNMVGTGPLYKTVANMAIEAATGDPRFSRLSENEISGIDIEISVLSPLKKVSSYNEIKIPGQGVMVRKGFNSGVYLPQVAAETGWNKEEFMSSLCAHKAGLAPNAWKDPSTELYVFSAEVFGEKEVGQ